MFIQVTYRIDMGEKDILKTLHLWKKLLTAHGQNIHSARTNTSNDWISNEK